MATSKTSHIATDLRYIISQLEKSAVDYNTTIAGLTMQTISDAVDDTGPQAMPRGIPEPGAGNRSPGWPAQHSRPSCTSPVAGLLVLPNAAFAAMQASWPTDKGSFLVEHHNGVSWKNDKGGENNVDDEGKVKSAALKQTRNNSASACLTSRGELCQLLAIALVGIYFGVVEISLERATYILDIIRTLKMLPRTSICSALLEINSTASSIYLVTGCV